MIQLYDPQTTDFTLNGHVLTDISNDVVTWKMNTTFELSFDYPLFSPHGAQLAKEMIVTVPTPDKFEHDQGFRINSVIKSMGIVTVHAYHLFWDLNQNFIEDINIVGDTGAEAIEHIMTNTQYDHTFRYTSDLVNTANARQVRMSAIKALIGDDDNSFITRFGGQFEWDNFEFNVQSSIGQNRGVVFRNGKNLTGYTFEENIDSVVTRIMPEGYDGLLLPEKYVDADNIGNYLNPRIAVIEYSDIKAIDPDATTTDEDAVPLEEAYEKLRTAAKAEFSDNNLDKPTNTISLNVILLENTEEYKDKGQFTKVYPGDTARFVHTDDNVDTEAQLTGYTWQPSNQEYLTVTFDSVTKTSPTLSQTISRVTKSISSVSENVKAVAANGDNGNNWGENAPVDGVDSAKEGDLWFEQRGSTLVMWIYENGHWVEEASDLTGEEIKKKVDEQFEGLATWKANVQSDLDLIKANNATFNAQVEALNVNYASMQESVAKIDASVKADISTLGAQAQSAIDALAKLQADQSDMSAKLTTVTNQTDELNGKVTQAVTTTQLADAQTSWTNAQRLITEGMITDEVSKVTIGGRNYILDSEYNWSTQPSDTGHSTNFGYDRFKTAIKGSELNGGKFLVSVQVDIENIKSSDNGRVGVEAPCKSLDGKSDRYPGAWKWMGADQIGNSFHDRIFALCDVGQLQDSPLNFQVYIQRITADSISVSNPMLEFASTPSDWVRALEDGLKKGDLDGYVTETVLDNKVTETESSFERRISESVTAYDSGNINRLYNSGTHVQATGDSGTNGNKTTGKYKVDRAVMGKTVTLSCFVNSDADQGTVYPQYGNGYPTWKFGAPSVNLKNGSTWTSFTFKVPAETDTAQPLTIQWRTDGMKQGQQVLITLAQLVIGENILSEWKANPDDFVLTTRLNDMKSDLDGTIQIIQNNLGDVSQITDKAGSLTQALLNAQGDILTTTALATGAQTLAANAATQVEVETMADQFTVIASGVKNGGKNYVLKSENNIAFPTNGGSAPGFELSTDISSFNGIDITLSFDVEIYGISNLLSWPRVGVEIAYTNTSGGTGYMGVWLPITQSDIGTNIVKRMSNSFKINDFKSMDSMNAYVQRFSSTTRIKNIQLEKGLVATPWKPAPEDNASQDDVEAMIAASQKGITLQVSEGVNNAFSDVKNADHVAALLNLSSDGMLIEGYKLHITAQTEIEQAAIKSAAIESLEADKIRAGTLNANLINVVNLNAASIVTGILSGANLSLNLNTGEVEFQKGRIHSASNNIDININEGYVSVADASSRVLLKGGELQFTETNMFSLEDSPYMRISNNLHGLGGVGVYGRSNISLTINNGGAASSLAGDLMGAETFRGVSVQDGSITKVGGANSGVLIRGGSAISGLDPIVNTTPFIGVGVTGSNGWGGREIHIVGQYTRIPSASNVTSSNSPNLVVGGDGTLMRSTSAAKYKTDIIRSASMDMANKLIGLPYATWADIAETKRYDEEPDRWPKPERNFGMIAEDLAGAGLEDLVIRNNGELEGIQYDRIVPALLPLLKNMKDRIGKLEEQLNGQTATA